MKKILINILICILAFHLFSQEKEDTIVANFGSADSMAMCHSLEFTDSVIKRIFDSVVQEEKNYQDHSGSNFFNVKFRENQRMGVLEMYIEVSDLLVVWNDSLPYNYGCIYYCERLFVVYGEEASLFFKKTEKIERLDLKCMHIYDSFPIIVDPDMWWHFYYNKGMWLYYDIERHKWRYYNYKERKWVDSE
ncbi:MAG: hypothetical protein IJK62_09445 [Bacteroidales bacterium]|nr:hypothetical protein [Bacteroidales bacterium]